MFFSVPITMKGPSSIISSIGDTDTACKITYYIIDNYNIRYFLQMSHLLQLVIELALLTLLLGYKDGANNSFNDLFLLNTELEGSFIEIVITLSI